MKLRLKALSQTNVVIISALTTLVSLIMLLPIAALIFESIAEYLPFGIDNSFDTTFSDLADTVLLDYVINSLSVCYRLITLRLFICHCPRMVVL